MKQRGSTLLMATAFVMAISTPFLSSTAVAGDPLTAERLETIEKLGRLTGIGLFCGYHDVAVPLKEVVIEVADKHKMDETLRAKLGFSYHSTRDKAFNGGKEGDYECPKLQQFQSEALLAKLNVSQAF
jgi:hypothetical protein